MHLCVDASTALKDLDLEELLDGGHAEARQRISSAKSLLRSKAEDDEAAALLSAQVHKEDRKILSSFVDPREAHSRWVLTHSTKSERQSWQALLVSRGYCPPGRSHHASTVDAGTSPAYNQHRRKGLTSGDIESISGNLQKHGALKGSDAVAEHASIVSPGRSSASKAMNPRRKNSAPSSPQSARRQPMAASKLSQEPGESNVKAKSLWLKSKQALAIAQRLQSQSRPKTVDSLRGWRQGLMHAFRSSCVSDVLAARCVCRDWHTACCQMSSLFIGHIHGEQEGLAALAQKISKYPDHIIREVAVTLVPQNKLQNGKKSVCFRKDCSVPGSVITSLFPGVKRLTATVDAVGSEADITDSLEFQSPSWFALAEGGTTDALLASVRALMQVHVNLIRCRLLFLPAGHSLAYLRGGVGHNLAPFLQQLHVHGVTLPPLAPPRNFLRGLPQSLFGSLANLHTLDCVFSEKEKLDTAMRMLPNLKWLRCSIPVCSELTIFSDVLESLDLKLTAAGDGQFPLKRLWIGGMMLKSLRLPEDDAMSSCGAGFFAEPMDVTLQSSALKTLVLPVLVRDMLGAVVGVPALRHLHTQPSGSFRNRVYRLKQAYEATLRGPNIDFQAPHAAHSRFDWQLKDIGSPIRVLIVHHIPHHWSLLVGQDSLATLEVCRVPRRTRRSDSKHSQRPPAYFMGKGLQRAKVNFIPAADAFCDACPNLKVLQINTTYKLGPKPTHCRIEEPLHVHGLPNLTSLVLECPWDCFALTLDLPALLDLQLSMYRVIGNLTLNCPQLRTWSLNSGAGPPPAKEWNLELEHVHTVMCELKAEAGFAAEDGSPSVIKWLPLFQFLPRLHHLEIVLDSSAEHGESPKRLRRIFLKTDVAGDEPSLQEFATRQRQRLSLNSPTANVVKLFVKQRLTWGYTLESLKLPSCVRLMTDALLMRDPSVYGEDEEIIQLPRLRDLHLMEFPIQSTLNDGAALTKALVKHMPLLHLIAFDAPRDCKLGERLPHTSKVKHLAELIWQEKPHLRITVGDKDVDQDVGSSKRKSTAGSHHMPLRKVATSPDLRVDKQVKSEKSGGKMKPKLKHQAKSVAFFTSLDKSSSDPALRGNAGKNESRLSRLGATTPSSLKDRLAFMRANDGKRPSSADIHKRRAHPLGALSLMNAMLDNEEIPSDLNSSASP